MHKYTQHVMKLAAAQLGIREKPRGSNRGPEVDAYIRSTGLRPPQPWCAAIETFIYKKAEKDLGVDLPWPNTASCDVILAWARSNSIIVSNPQPGDVFLCMASKSDAIHTGWVRDSVRIVQGVRKFRSIEGNSNSSGSREGYECCSNDRAVSGRLLFLRPELLYPTEKPPVPQLWPVFHHGQLIGQALIENGRAYFDSSDWARVTGQTIGWDAETRAVLLNGKPVPDTPRLSAGNSMFPIVLLAHLIGLQAVPSKGRIDIVKAKTA